MITAAKETHQKDRLNVIRKNSLESLEKPFYLKLLQLEEQISSQDYTRDTISDIVQMYARLVEQYDNAKDPITIYFLEKIQIVLSCSEIVKKIFGKNEEEKPINNYNNNPSMLEQNSQIKNVKIKQNYRQISQTELDTYIQEKDREEQQKQKNDLNSQNKFNENSSKINTESPNTIQHINKKQQYKELAKKKDIKYSISKKKQERGKKLEIMIQIQNNEKQINVGNFVEENDKIEEKNQTIVSIDLNSQDDIIKQKLLKRKQKKQQQEGGQQQNEADQQHVIMSPEKVINNQDKNSKVLAQIQQKKLFNEIEGVIYQNQSHDNNQIQIQNIQSKKLNYGVQESEEINEQDEEEQQDQNQDFISEPAIQNVSGGDLEEEEDRDNENNFFSAEYINDQIYQNQGFQEEQKQQLSELDDDEYNNQQENAEYQQMEENQQIQFDNQNSQDYNNQQNDQNQKVSIMEDNLDIYNMAEVPVKKGQPVRKYTFKGKTLEDLKSLGKADDKNLITKELVELFDTKVRRRISRGLGFQYKNFIQKVRKSKAKQQPGEKPPVVKTHYRSMIVIPEMVGAVIGIYSGREFTPVEIKFDMIGKYLGEFAMTYKPTKHGRPGVGATKGSQHTDKK